VDDAEIGSAERMESEKSLPAVSNTLEEGKNTSAVTLLRWGLDRCRWKLDRFGTMVGRMWTVPS
jgi:hypothetical protein